MNLAPIILFVYNRPEHTLQTLEALSGNDLADKSVLYIYCDGLKDNAGENQMKRILEVREIIRKRQWCKKVYIREQNKNKGLADSIIDGVTEIINQHGRVIVLEDDLETSPGFLNYMNEALELYKDEEKVMHVSGYWFPVRETYQLPETFFYNTASCWGWGTWERAWKKLETDPDALLVKIKAHTGGVRRFNIENGFDFISQINENISGKIKTWAIKWYASIFLNEGFSLHPNKSLVNNIGWDNFGTHCNGGDIYWWKDLADKIEVRKGFLIESKQARRMIKRFYKTSNKVKIKSIISSVIPRFIKNEIRWLIGRDIERKYHYLKKVPRFQPITIKFKKKSIQIVDSASFLFMYEEIFGKEIYKFRSLSNHPYIIDGGANIGLSVIYFKQLYPEAEIVAFEPDLKVFKAFEHNINEFDFSNVAMIQKGLWNEDAVVSFFSEGADGGRIALQNDPEKIKIQTIRLRPFIERKVDFLKLDIEGAETSVIEDCADLLYQVDNIFVEYHSFQDKAQSLDKILHILNAQGFRYYINHVGVVSPHPFYKKEVALGMDNQLNIYASKY